MRASKPIAVGQAGRISALDHVTGKVVWQVGLGEFDGATACQGEEISLGIVDGRLLLAGCAGHAFCFDLSTGRLIWHRDLRVRGKSRTDIVF